MKKCIAFVLLLLSGHLYSQNNTDSLEVLEKIKYGNTRDTIGVFDSVSSKASYPGGRESWRRYVATNLNIREALEDVPLKKQDNFRQTIHVRFIVCSDGTVCRAKVVEGDALPSIKREAIKVIINSGLWKPANYNGIDVKSYHIQPVTFIMQTL